MILMHLRVFLVTFFLLSLGLLLRSQVANAYEPGYGEGSYYGESPYANPYKNVYYGESSYYGESPYANPYRNVYYGEGSYYGESSYINYAQGSYGSYAQGSYYSQSSYAPGYSQSSYGGFVCRPPASCGGNCILTGCSAPNANDWSCDPQCPGGTSDTCSSAYGCSTVTSSCAACGNSITCFAPNPPPSYSQSAYTYSQGAYGGPYAEGTYYSESKYYTQGSYYSQSAYVGGGSACASLPDIKSSFEASFDSGDPAGGHKGWTSWHWYGAGGVLAPNQISWNLTGGYLSARSLKFAYQETPGETYSSIFTLLSSNPLYGQNINIAPTNSQQLVFSGFYYFPTAADVPTNQAIEVCINQHKTWPVSFAKEDCEDLQYFLSNDPNAFTPGVWHPFSMISTYYADPVTPNVPTVNDIIPLIKIHRKAAGTPASPLNVLFDNFCVARVSAPIVNVTVFGDSNGNGCFDPPADTLISGFNVRLDQTPDTFLNNGTVDPTPNVNSSSSNPNAVFNLSLRTALSSLSYGALPAPYTSASVTDPTSITGPGVCTPSNSFKPTSGSTIPRNIALTNTPFIITAPWFTTYDGDVYGASILDKLPGASYGFSNNWLINRLVAIDPAGAALSPGTIVTHDSGGTNRTSKSGSNPGWEAAGITPIQYFTSGSLSSTTPTGLVKPIWGSLAADHGYTTSLPLPAGYSVTGASGGVAVVYVPGGLTISSNFTSANLPKQGVILIVDGDIIVKSNVTQIDAVLIARGAGHRIVTENSGVTNLLTINGGVYSQFAPDLSRSLSSGGSSGPSIAIKYNPLYLNTKYSGIVNTKYFWQELAP